MFVSVTESVYTTINEEEEPTSPSESVALGTDSTDEGSGKEVLPPTPPPQAVKSKSKPIAITETPKEEIPPETVVISEFELQQPLALPQ